MPSRMSVSLALQKLRRISWSCWLLTEAELATGVNGGFEFDSF